jgi:HEAT repeat protein
MFSQDCAIEGGAVPITWLSGVAPAESVAFLARLAGEPTASRRAMKGAVSALAQHGVPEAVTPLIRLARQAPEPAVRGEALFWLAQRAGDRAAGAISDAIEHDPETQVKKRAVFALSQLPSAEGIPKLIAVARTHANPAVRKQAIFWLGQSKDPRALAFFEEVLK